MSTLLTAFLLMGTTVSDSGQTMPLPIATAYNDSLSADSSIRHSGEEEPVSSRIPEQPDSSTNPMPLPDFYPVYRLLTPEGLNIETLETAALDDDGCEIERSVKLNEHEQKMGLGWLIPGGVMGFLGIIICTVAFDSRWEETMDTDDLAPVLALGGSMMLCGSFGISVGIHKLRKHSRWHDRYRHSTRDLKTRPVVLSVYLHP